MGRLLPNKLVFINCPFDPEFRPLFEAIVFTINACDYSPRCALESIDSGQNRLAKIIDLIDVCDFSLHDLSRTELNLHELPRFNMPFELGLAIGRKYPKGKASRMLVMDKISHRYLEFLSDMRGCDMVSHNNDAGAVVGHVRDWLSSYGEFPLNGPNHMRAWFERFQLDLPGICEACGLDRLQMSFTDLVFCVRFWVQANIPSV